MNSRLESDYIHGRMCQRRNSMSSVGLCGDISGRRRRNKQQGDQCTLFDGRDGEDSTASAVPCLFEGSPTRGQER